MNWYILLAHPNPASFNHAVCNAFVEGLKQAGAAYRVNDLYASGFNPLMAGDDFNQFEDGGVLPEDVLAEQTAVEGSDGLALIYPVWWNEAPAILKGWLDRVLSKGWAYDISAEGEFQSLLTLKKVVILRIYELKCLWHCFQINVSLQILFASNFIWYIVTFCKMNGASVECFTIKYCISVS